MTAATSFKVGDRVRVISAPYYGADDLIGEVGTVYDVRPDGECRIGDGDVRGPRDSWTWSAWVGAQHLESAAAGPREAFLQWGPRSHAVVISHFSGAGQLWVEMVRSHSFVAVPVEFVTLAEPPVSGRGKETR